MLCDVVCVVFACLVLCLCVFAYKCLKMCVRLLANYRVLLYGMVCCVVSLVRAVLFNVGASCVLYTAMPCGAVV